MLLLDVQEELKDDTRARDEAHASRARVAPARRLHLRAEELELDPWIQLLSVDRVHAIDADDFIDLLRCFLHPSSPRAWSRARSRRGEARRLEVPLSRSQDRG